jgi:copper resistance protein C
MTLHTRRMGRTMLTVLIISAVGVLVQGHTKLEKTEPANGATVNAPVAHLQLSFNEAVDPAVSKIDLTGPSGKVAVGPVHAMGKMLKADVTEKTSDGKYTVAWQAAGDDGHVIKGEFSFSVQAKKTH